MTLKNNRAPFLCYFKLCASFHSHWWIQTGVKSLETPNLGQIRRFFQLSDLEFWQMTLNKANLRDLIAATCLVILLKFYPNHWFLACVSLKFDAWPKTRQIWGIWKLRLAYNPETPNLGQNRWCFVLCDLEIWWMTLGNNRASLLCCFKLCATFHSHWWIQTGVTVPKRPIRVKFDNF